MNKKYSLFSILFFPVFMFCMQEKMMPLIGSLRKKLRNKQETLVSDSLTFHHNFLEQETIAEPICVKEYYKKNPLSFQKQKISLVSCGLGDLESFPTSGTESVKTLILSKNLISSVGSDFFCSLQQLEHLWLDDNLLTSFPPEMLSHSVNLRLFSSKNNNLKYLPDGFFSKCTNLICIHLEGNKITDLSPCDFPRGVEQLFLAGNPISKDTIQKLKKKFPKLQVDIEEKKFFPLVRFKKKN